MDPVSIIADAQIVISLAKLAYQVGQDALPYIERAYQLLFNNKSLTEQERTDMAAQEAAWRADIDAVIAKDDAEGQ